MDLAKVWKHYLENWPRGLQRNGVVVTSAEQIVFVSFLMSETVVMFERRAPDAVGGRKVVLPYSLIQAIKVTEPIGNEPFLETGFSESLPSVAEVSATAAPATKTAAPSARPSVPQKA